MDSKLWFLQLSGWPVLLVIVALVFVFMIALSIALNWISSRSVVQSVMVAVMALVLVSLGLLGFGALLSRC